MNTVFLEARSVRRRLKQYMEDYDEFHWAVAWGTHLELTKRLFAHRSKFKNVTFGVAFSQTEPDIVDGLVGLPNCYVATKFAKGTYHPKVYGFQSGKQVAAIVGSANFTNGGLENNLEAAVAITGTIDEPALAAIFVFIQECVKYGQPVDKTYAEAYRASHARASRMPKPPRDPVPPAQNKAVNQLAAIGWDEYSRQVKLVSYHDMIKRLKLIAIARRWFATEASFADFAAPQRKAIAGTLGKYQKQDDETSRDWGWFGSMGGSGDFANRIEKNDQSLARALDGIPSSGEVTRRQYDRYCSLFRAAFKRSSRTGGVPTATRLLAMKRPDTFLCVCSPNIVAASKALGFAHTTLNLENYWERVVEPIRRSAWYNVDKPDHPGGELWEARAAMLDALFYRP